MDKKNKANSGLFDAPEPIFSVDDLQDIGQSKPSFCSALRINSPSPSDRIVGGFRDGSHELSGFFVTDDDRNRQTGWTITGLRVIIATPPSGIFSKFFRLGFGQVVSSTRALIDSTGSSVTLGIPTYNGTTNKVSFTIIFNENVPRTITDLTGSDFSVWGRNNEGTTVTVSGWTWDSIQSSIQSGTTITISVVPPRNIVGTDKEHFITLNHATINRGGFSQNNGPIEADPTGVPTTLWFFTTSNTVGTFEWENVTGGETLQATLVITGAISGGIDTSDLAILNSSNVVQSGWSFRIGTAVTVDDPPSTRFGITATGASNINGSFKIRIKEETVRTGGSQTDNAPASDVDSTLVTVDNRVLNLLLGTPSFCASSGTRGEITTQLTGNYSFTGLNSNSIDVLPRTGNTLLPGWTHIISGSGSSRTITTTPPINTNGIYRLRLDMFEVNFRGTSWPANAIISSVINIDNRLRGGEEVAIFWSNLTGGTTLTGRLTFTGQDFTGIAPADFEVLLAATGIADTRFTITTSATSVKAGQYITVTATPSSTLNIDTDYQFRLKMNSVRSGTSTSDNSPSVNIDSNNIHLSTLISWGTPTGGSTLTATMTFRGSIERIDLTDFDILDQTDVVQSGWTIAFSPTGTTSRTNGQTLDIIATPPALTNNIFRIRLRRQTMRLGSSGSDTVPTLDLISSGALVNNIVTPVIPMVPSEAFWSDLTGGTSLSGRITFPGNAIASITASDFDVILALTGVAETRFTITVNSTTAKQGQYVMVTATPASTLRIDTDYQLRLKANSVRSDGSATDNFPTANIDSNNIHLNTIVVWGTPTGGTTLTATMTFRSEITRIDLTDFDILDQTDIVQSNWTIAFSPTGTTSRQENETLDIIATPPSNTNDIFRIRLRRHTMRLGTSGSADTVPTDNTISSGALVNNIVTPVIPMVSSGAFWSELIGGTSLSGNITFPENAVGSIEPADFDIILAATGIASRQFTITTSSTSAKHGQYVTVTATPSSGLNVDTNFQFRLKADTTRADGSMTDNFPEVNIDSNDVHLSTILSWGDPSGGTTLEVPLNFRSDIDDIGPDDFEVLDSLNEITTGWTITLNPNVSSRDSGESLTVIGTPPENTDDAFRLRVKSNSMRFDISTENHIPIVSITSRAARVNNFPIDMSVDPPYILATVPDGTDSIADPFKTVQTPTNNPTRTITLTITSEVAGTLTNIDNLRNTDFIISSPEGNIVPTLT